MAKITRADMQRLIDQRDLILKEIEALRNKVAGIELSISLLDTGAIVASGSSRATRSVKTILLDFLRDVGTTGLSALQAVEMANRRGISLNSGSVSSTLSRFKKDGIVQLEGDKYRLTEFVQPSQSAVIRPAGWGVAA